MVGGVVGGEGMVIQAGGGVAGLVATEDFDPHATRTVFIGNLEKNVSHGELRGTFEQFGDVVVSTQCAAPTPAPVAEGGALPLPLVEDKAPKLAGSGK